CRAPVDDAIRAAQRYAADCIARARGHRGCEAGRQDYLRKDVGRVAIEEAERAVEPFGAPARRETPVAEAAAVARRADRLRIPCAQIGRRTGDRGGQRIRSEEHTSEL